MSVQERLEVFRKEMKACGITAYLLPTSDFHMSEYVHPYFQGRIYFGGFSGDSGTLLITLDGAYLWTDGRFFIQAENELKGTGVTLMKMGEPGVPTIAAFLKEHLDDHSTFGVDGRTISVAAGENYAKICEEVGARFFYDIDVVAKAWKERPALPSEKLFILDEKYCGRSMKSKVEELREKSLSDSDVYVDAMLDDIAYLTNLRGRDVACNPVFLSYLVVNKKEIHLFVEECKLTEEVKTYLDANDVCLHPYNDIYEYLKTLNCQSVKIDKAKMNFMLFESINDTNTCISEASPIEMMKACKNEVEVANLRKSHLKDGVAVTKFMYWLKNTVGKEEIGEVRADEMITGLRAKQEGFIERSFETIAGYREHAAMMHYAATKESEYFLEPKDMLLVDSGGQYYEGTTDITRTFALGPVSDAMKRDFTLTLKGVITLSMQKFLYGCGGLNLDLAARHALWNAGIDYKCGTGHGVGYCLNVHEGPHGLRWMHANRGELTKFEEGMVVTNEPGVYKEGEYGIRIENEMLVRKGIANEYGQFMEFETITYVPIDLDLVVPELLNNEERAWLNAYHSDVREKLLPYMDTKEAEFLKMYTREI